MATAQPTVDPTRSIDAVIELHPSQILPWALNPPDELHERAANQLVQMWRHDPVVTAELARMPWIADGIEEDDLRPLRYLWDIRNTYPELSERLSPHLQHGYSREMIDPVRSFLGFNEESAIRLLDLPWFADGLNREEAALMTPLLRLLSDYDTEILFATLLQSHYTQSGIVSLPLAGDTNIWVFSNEPFNQEQDLTSVIAEAAFITEGLIGEPFPEEDIILLGLQGEDFGNLWRAEHLGDHMRVTDFNESAIRHETAHYYFDGSVVPVWLSEGTASFMEEYIERWPGGSLLESSRRRAERNVKGCNREKRIGNIVELNRMYKDYPPAWECAYHMGENFLHQIYHALGEAAVGAALGDVYRLAQSRNYIRVAEVEIYRAFQSSTPVGCENVFHDIYRRYHGGEYSQ